MGARRIRREQRREDMAESRINNGMRKMYERERRKLRMVDCIKKQGQLPYTPVVMSWLSMELDKPSRLIKQEEVNSVIGS